MIRFKSFVDKRYPNILQYLTFSNMFIGKGLFSIIKMEQKDFRFQEMRFVVKFCHMLQLVPIMNGTQI